MRAEEIDFDVVTSISFTDRSALDRRVEILGEGETNIRLVNDASRFKDRETMPVRTVEESGV